MMAFPDVANGIAGLLRAVAWPAIVVFLAVRYHDQMGRLIDRLRKGGPAEFDPLPAPQTRPTGGLPAGPDGWPNAVQHIRTPAVQGWEAKLKNFQPLVAEQNPAHREAILLTLAAKAVLVAWFERTEAVIYASQVELLNYLNARADGELTSRLQELFYEPARARFPQVYANAAFETYLGFLQGSDMVSLNNLKATITSEGREYLMWRIEQKKLPRAVG